jgi:hypothetical protein
MNESELIKALKVIDSYLYEGDKDNAHLLLLKLLKKLAKTNEVGNHTSDLQKD